MLIISSIGVLNIVDETIAEILLFVRYRHRSIS